MNHSIPSRASNASVKMNLIQLCLAVFLPLLLSPYAHGATIIWDATPSTVNLADESQVFTTGTLVVAATANPAGATVNGVAFTPFASSTSYTKPSGSGIGITNDNPANYANILNYMEYLNNGLSANPGVFSGLTIGQQYKLQIWMPYNYDYFPTRFGSASNGSENSPVLLNGLTATSTTPQYIFGTFTADSTTQNLYQFGDTIGFSILGAVELRAVPEPQSWALAALGASAVLFRLRRKQRGE